MSQAYEPKRNFRWMLSVPGMDSFMMKSVQSLEGQKILIKTHWLVDQSWPQEPTAREGVIKFLAEDGSVTDQFPISWESHEVLPFDLDYADAGGMAPGILLKNVHITR